MAQKYLFFNDYSEGAHPQVLKALETYNAGQEPGYGEDSITKKATELIRKRVGDEKAAVYFTSGGTQANIVVIASMLKHFESVVAPKSAHINTHEAGAIEAGGHKVDAVETSDGKITPEQIESVVGAAMPIHMAKPRAVFISNSTEVGTIYTKTELTQISEICKRLSLYLYLDGARLGSALTSTKNDLTLEDIAKLTDVFYIGGTKNAGAMGEAIIITNPDIANSFAFHLKQQGALLAKGRFIPAQFIALFENNLFFDLAKHANAMAEKLTQGIGKLGFAFLTDAPSNQIFPILANTVIEKLEKLYGFYVWEEVDSQKSALRLVTSWATPEEKVDEFLADLKKLI